MPRCTHDFLMSGVICALEEGHLEDHVPTAEGDEMRHFQDTALSAVPRSMLDDDAMMAAMCLRLDVAVQTTIALNYPKVQIVGIEWLFCTTEQEIEAWPLPHDCEGCRVIRSDGITLLRADPNHETAIALGTVHCVEPL